jgi:hypothetical protein
MVQKLNDNQIDRLWQHIEAVQNRFDNRLNFFLIFESILMGVVGMLYSRPSSVNIVLIFVICLGILLTVIWQYVQARERYLLDDLENKLKEVVPEYQETVVRRERVKWPIGSTVLLTFGVPPIVGIMWILILILFLKY